MASRSLRITPRQWASWLILAAAAVVAAWFGYDVGLQISGPGMGVVMAANAAVFAWLLTSAVVARLLRGRKQKGRDGP